MKVGPKSSLRPFLHRALQLLAVKELLLNGMNKFGAYRLTVTFQGTN